MQLMEFNIGDHTALKLAEADTRREALDEATRDAPPGAGDGLGSQTEPDEEGMAENAVETMSLTEAPASSNEVPRQRTLITIHAAGRCLKLAGRKWLGSLGRLRPLVVNQPGFRSSWVRNVTRTQPRQTRQMTP